jgi:hypothetical protein
MVLRRPLALREGERVSQDSVSDSELPECFHFAVTPCGTADPAVTQSASRARSTDFGLLKPG